LIKINALPISQTATNQEYYLITNFKEYYQGYYN